MRRSFIAVASLCAALGGCSFMLDWEEAPYVGEEPGRDAGPDVGVPPGRDAAAPGPDAAAPGPDASTVDYLAVWGTSEDNVWAVGASGTIQRWTKAKGWTDWTMPSQQDIELRGIWGSGPNDVFVVGSTGRILHFDGSTWGQQEHNNRGQNLNAIWGFSSGDIFAVGDNTTVAHYNLDAATLKMTWGMNCWDPPPADICPTSGKLVAMGGGTDPDIVGDKRFLWVGGEKLFRRSLVAAGTHYIAHPTPGFVRAIRVTDRDAAWAVGAGGMLLQLDRSGTPPQLASGTTKDLWGLWTSQKQLRAVGNDGTLVCCAINAGKAENCAACASPKIPTSLAGASLRGIWGDEATGEYWVVGLNGVRVHWVE